MIKYQLFLVSQTLFTHPVLPLGRAAVSLTAATQPPLPSPYSLSDSALLIHFVSPWPLAPAQYA